MSRGLGRVEQTILHHVYHEPRRTDSWGFNPRSLASTRSEEQSLHRAARSVVKKGLVRQVGPWSNNLHPLDPPPVSVANCRTCTQVATLSRDGVTA